MSTEQQRQAWRELAEHAKRTNLLDLSAYQLRALIHAVPHLLTEMESLTAERDALTAELATVRAQLAESEQEVQALKDEIEYTFTRLGNPLIRTQPQA